MRPIVIGLHITKCAGTTLVTTLRRNLGEDQYYFCSSYHQNWLAGRPMLWELPDTARISIVFGHFCHEYLLSVFQRPKILITGLRNPLGRAISHFYQINAVNDAFQQPLITADEFLKNNANTMCTEIIRCFPTIDALSNAPKWIKACSALSMFDFLYSTEHFDQDALHILQSVGVASGKLWLDNITARKNISPKTLEFLDAEVETIRKRYSEYFDQDEQLYQSMLPYLSTPNLQRERAFDGQPWHLDRVQYIAELPPEKDAMHAYAEIERSHFAYQFAALGRVPELVQHLDQRLDGWQRVRRLAEQRQRDRNRK